MSISLEKITTFKHLGVSGSKVCIPNTKEDLGKFLAKVDKGILVGRKIYPLNSSIDEDLNKIICFELAKTNLRKQQSRRRKR